MTERFTVGVITATHGIQGEVKVFPTTDDAGRFKKLKVVTAETGKENYILHIERVKFFKQYVIVKFSEYSDINDIGFLIKAKLTIPREDAISLDTDEYYVADLIGLKVITDDGEDFGVIKDVLETGANDVYIIDNNGKEILVPAIRDCILGVDIEAGIMRIHLMEGLV
ncbi:MAG: ribosome maturation factor RimM [Lachnospiraceae bacterium]|nr:ribosome maturation factor RimM [Lachnospiraceae bacterium]